MPRNGYLATTHDPGAAMRIVIWGTYDTGKPRIRILREGLRARGVEITEIHAEIWQDIGDKSAIRGARGWLSRGMRLLLAYPRLAWRYLRAPDHDLVLVSYPGQLDILVLRIFASLRRKPIVFDWFISAYDTVVMDRALVRRRSMPARALWLVEWLAARAANLAIMDTATHARRVEQLFGVAPASVAHVWVGAEDLFFARGAPKADDGELKALFYGQFIPLHGIDTIIEAARLLRDAPIRWTLLGRGQEAQRIRAMLDADPLPKLEWIDWVPYETLPARMAAADVCLGIFGTSDKAASVIPNKVFQIVAAGRPLVTRDSAAIRELLGNAPPCVRLVNAGDAGALAGSILEYAQNRHTRLSRDCFATLRHRIDSSAIAQQFLTAVCTAFPRLDTRHDR